MNLERQFHNPISQILTRKQAANFLGVKENTLAVWAVTKRQPLPYIKVGRLVKYRLADLQAFLENNVHQSNEA